MKLSMKKTQGITLILLMMMAAFAGCIGGDDSDDDSSSSAAGDSSSSTADTSDSSDSSDSSDTSDASDSDGSDGSDSSDSSSSDSSGGSAVSTMDGEDGGYTYASNVDNHRSLMADMCDIKAHANAGEWTAAKGIYTNGKNAEKSDGSYRTLQAFAAASGKNHGYDAFYGADGSVDAMIMDALEGTGDFAGVSDTVRYQGIAKLTANLGMVAYTIHELNTAVAKADAGNVDNDTGAPHNWDEGWAFFHGPDENVGCSPVATLNKRGADFGTEHADGMANTTYHIQQSMINGLAALQAEDQTGYTDATNDVVKQVIIAYSQAVLKYTYKMDNADNGPKYQAEAYAFWKTIEAYAAPYTDNACYNMQSHTMGWVGSYDNTSCDDFAWYENASMGGPNSGTFTGCYNMVSHTVAEGVDQAQCEGGFSNDYFYANYGATSMNNILDLQDASVLGTSYDVTAWLQPVWDHYGITAEEIGSYS